MRDYFLRTVQGQPTGYYLIRLCATAGIGNEISIDCHFDTVYIDYMFGGRMFQLICN